MHTDEAVCVLRVPPDWAWARLSLRIGHGDGAWSAWGAVLPTLAIVALSLVLAWGVWQLGCFVVRRRRGDAVTSSSEALYRSLFEESRDGVYISTPNGRLTDINPAGVDLFGYVSREEILAADVPRDLYEFPNDRAIFIHQVAEQGFVKDLELRMKRKNGEQFTALVTATAMRNPAGRIIAYRGIIRDVTEQRNLQLQLQRAQKLEAVGVLAAGVAHDFNNLLTAITGYVGLAKATLAPGHSAMRSLEMVEQAARQASGVTRSLLTFSRQEPTEKSPVLMGRLVTESIRLIRQILPANVEIVEHVPPHPDLWVNADATQLQQVLMNITINARDAMLSGGQFRLRLQPGGPLTVEGASAETDPDAPHAALVLEDTGTGMSEEVHARIFDPFFTTKPRSQGTGLGLSVTHGIISAHRGTIDVDSALGRGTRVTISLPCCAPPAETDEPHRPASAARGHGEVVFVVEDNDYVRSIMTSTLRAQGYDVVQAADGVEAMQALEVRQDVARLVILDLDLPKADGLSCLREMRERRLGVSVVVVTGRVDVPFDEGLEGADHVLQKPFPMAELARVVAEVLEQSKRADEVAV